MKAIWKKLVLAICFVSFLSMGLGSPVIISKAEGSTGSVTVDYSATTATAGKYVFGISCWPRMNPNYAQKLAHAGVTMIRQSSLLLSDIVPSTTLTDYQNNVNNVQDASTWNWNPNGNTETMPETDVAAFQDAGIKVFSILSGIPSWLGYSGMNSMPRDWTVYRDLEKKLFQHYQDRIEYFEIFNEPEIELNMTGSGYTDSYTAYRDLYYNSLQAINEVNTYNRNIGGPANLANAQYLHNMLTDNGIKDDLDFASWHRYNETSTYDCGIKDWKYEEADHGKADLPLFVTEYNVYKDVIAMDSVNAISWVGGRITTLMNNGATGAFLYGTDDRASGLNASVRHDWKIINQDGTFTPRVWPIRLLSKQLGLGTGDNQMKLTNYTGVTLASAAVNSEGFPVVWVVNDSVSSVTTDVALNNIGYTGKVTLTHYLASGGISDASSVYAAENKYVNDGMVSTTITIPAKSVYGIAVAKNIALSSTYNTTVPASSSYPDTSGTELTDGIYGNYLYSNAAWQGRAGLTSYSYTLDLGSSKSIQQLQAGFLRDDMVNIDLPSTVSYAVSVDGSSFTTVGTVNKPSSAEDTMNAYKLNTNTTGRYVKVTVEGSWSSTHWCFIDEIRVLQSSSSQYPENLALNRTYTSSIAASTSYPDTSGTELTNGRFSIDSYKDKSWQGRAGLTSYNYTIDLGESQRISEFQSFFLRDDSALISLPDSVEYLVSTDNITFSSVGTVSTPGSTDISTNNFKLKKSTEGRYVKVVINGSWANKWVFIDEVKIIKGFENLASGRTATASTALSGFDAGKAVDGIYYSNNASNCWASTSGNDVGAWWKVDLGSSKNISTVKVQYRGYQNTGEPLWFHMTLKTLTIQVSADNSNWITVHNKSPNVPTLHTTFSQGLYTYEIGVYARYVKLIFEDGTEDSTKYAELVEVEIY